MATTPGFRTFVFDPNSIDPVPRVLPWEVLQYVWLLGCAHKRRRHSSPWLYVSGAPRNVMRLVVFMACSLPSPPSDAESMPLLHLRRIRRHRGRVLSVLYNGFQYWEVFHRVEASPVGTRLHCLIAKSRYLQLALFLRALCRPTHPTGASWARLIFPSRQFEMANFGRQACGRPAASGAVPGACPRRHMRAIIIISIVLLVLLIS